MDKKNVLVNVLLVMVLVALALGAYFIKTKIGTEQERIASQNVVLKDVDYGSEVMKVGTINADGIFLNFIEAYNTKNGEQLVQLMDLVATYIYADCEYDAEFDKKYEEKLSSDMKTEELILMQYSLQREEKGILEGIANSDIQLTLIESSEIEDVSKYLSKMTIKVRTVSETEGLDEIDTLEFMLLHRDGFYHIIKFDMKDSVPYSE